MGVDAKTDMKGVEVSEAAARKIAALLAGEPDKIGLRVAVEGGGCSGFSYIIDLTDTKNDDDTLIERVFRINAMGPLYCVRSFLPLLRKRERAVIVNLSSVAARRGQGSSVAYCGAKAAVDTMTISLGRALAPAIRVVAVAPGPVDTDMARMWTPEQHAAIGEATPLGWAAPEDIAVTIYAAVTMMPKVTGTTVLADGGRALV